jgi:hypothetical protein
VDRSGRDGVLGPFTVLGSGPVLGTVLGILLVSGAVIAW